MRWRSGAMLFAAALLLAGCGGVDRRDYVRRNEAIVKSLPALPGAVATQEFSTPRYSAGEMSPSGYTTTVVYRVGPRTNGSGVRRFYETWLEQRGWDRGSRSRKAWLVEFTRGDSLVVVNTVTLRPLPGRDDRFYVVAADYRGAKQD